MTLSTKPTEKGATPEREQEVKQRINYMKHIASLIIRLSAIAEMFLPGHLVASVTHDANVPQVAFAAQELNVSNGEWEKIPRL